MDLTKLYTETLLFFMRLNQIQLSIIVLIPLTLVILYQVRNRLSQQGYTIELIVIGEESNDHTIHKLTELKQGHLFEGTKYPLDLNALYLEKGFNKKNKYIQLYRENGTEALTFNESKQNPQILNTVKRSQALQNIELGVRGFSIPDKRTIFIIIVVIVMGVFIYRYYQGGIRF